MWRRQHPSHRRERRQNGKLFRYVEILFLQKAIIRQFYIHNGVRKHLLLAIYSHYESHLGLRIGQINLPRPQFKTTKRLWSKESLGSALQLLALETHHSRRLECRVFSILH